MLKEPVAGRVKTRLGEEIGMTAAAWWFRHQSSALIRRLRDPRWQLVLAVSPDREGVKSRVWPGDLPRLTQGQGNLGARMNRVFSVLPRGPVLIVGADVPGIQASHISRGFQALGSCDAVVGPAPDGGFWAIGLKRLRPAPRHIFVNVRWSTKHALEDTLSTLEGIRVAKIDTLDDVDTAADL